MNKYLYICIFVTLLFYYNNCQEITNSFNSSNYNVKTINLLGTELSVASATLHFDEPLYLLESYSCSNFTCPPYDHACPPCDFTHAQCGVTPAGCADPDKCSKVIVRGSQNTSPCSLEWQDLQFNTWTRGYVPGTNTTSQFKIFRYYAPDVCQGYKISLKIIQGETSLMVDYVPFHPTLGAAARTVLSNQIDTHVVICPNNTIFDGVDGLLKEYPYGTIHIGVLNSLYIDLIFDIIIEPISVPEPVPVAPGCVQVDPTIPCLEDGTPVSLTSLPKGTFLKYSFTFTSCKNITVSSITLENDVDLYAHTDSDISKTKYTWSSTYSLDDNIIIQVCPDPGQSSKTIYIGVDCFYESSVFFFLTTHGQYQLRDISDNPAPSGTWALSGTTFLQNTVTNEKLRCDNYDLACVSFFPLYPRTENNPLYPVPGVFDSAQGLSRFKGIAFNETDNVGIKNTYQFAIILNLVIDGVKYEYFDESDLEHLQIKFLNRLVLANGKAINQVIDLKNKIYEECTYDNFLLANSRLDQLVDRLETTEPNLINGMRYQMDVTTFQDAYYSCKVMAENYLILNTTTSVMNTTICQTKFNTDAYRQDPCCSKFASFGQCCRQRPIEVVQQTFVDTVYDKVKEECSFPECTNSVLKTFVPSIIGSQFDSCAVSADQENFYSESLYRVFRNCTKYLLTQASCKTDADCLSYYGKPYKCGIRTDTCVLPVEDIEQNYVYCVLRDIPPPLRTEVLSFNNITTTNITELVPILYDLFSSPDCVTDYGVYLWSRTTYAYSSDGSTVNYCYPYPLGLDRSAGLDHYDICYQGVYQYLWLGQLYNEKSCNSLSRCDWLGESGTMDQIGTSLNAIDYLASQCADASAPEYFCGDCTDTMKNCYSNLALNETECSSSYVCYQPVNGVSILDYSFDTTNPSDCDEGSGVCSVSCGQSCGGSACIVAKASYVDCSQELILQNGGYDGYYYDDNGDIHYYCSYYYLDNTDCTTNGGVVADCSQFSAEQCTVCGDGPYSDCSKFGLQCNLFDQPCTTKESCEQAGECSDKFYFKYPLNNYPTYQPKCYFPRNTTSIFSSSYPTCEYQHEQDSPLGCFKIDQEYLNETYCIEMGGKVWKEYSKTQEQCEGYSSMCYGVDNSQTFLPSLTYRYNPKDQDDCECAGETWKKPFSWTKGVWNPGRAQKLEWIKTKKELTPIASYRRALSFENFFSAFNSASYRRTTLLFKSEVLCRISNSKSSLKALSCGCKTDIGNSCFDDIKSPILSIIKPCYDPPTSYSVLETGVVHFRQGSIRENFCISISLSEIFKDTYLSKMVIDLSSTFVSFEKPADYSIYNENKAVIGRVLTDGVSFDIFEKGVNNFELCLLATNSRSSKFDHIDYALLQDNEFGIVSPLFCNITIDDQNRYCCVITSIDQTISDFESKNATSNPTYLLIERLEQVDIPYKPIDNGGLAMIYLLAIIYLLMAIYGLMTLSFFVIQKFVSKESFRLVHLLFIFMTAFSLIRSIYFFILPTNSINSSDVGDYILVVLPVFLYFTAFTIVVVIWYILSADNYSANIYKKIYSIILIINIILYILFVVVVLVFNFTREKAPPTCGGRILAGLSNTTPQRVVSILYAVLQAFISLIVGIAFLYYGRKVYLKLTQIKGSSTENAKYQQRKTFWMALICSTGFVLHCIFIIVLVSATPSNIVFSFVCLIITEVVPVCTLFVANNQFPIKKYSKKSVRKVLKLSKNLSNASEISSKSSSSKRDRTETTSNYPETTTSQ
ncbi:hypothetical protein CYY_008438 [Polysphondylium violaceum]|uniref:THH1/TOM1/TOM3 domain-containing protein n=1 Tax=Polysphondylium violaceum TaxID=133409 RepID=A0A8J4PLP1_9MYCE|nr:hypothetical protein CYY_008438 [Polysphondylium violaceum]